MADFDTNYWGGGSYTPTDYSVTAYAPNYAPIAMDYAGGYSAPVNYQQPTYYDQYAGFAPDWGSAGAGYDNGWTGFASPSGDLMGSISGGLSSAWGGIKDWLGAPADQEGGATNGSKLLSGGITAGIGAIGGLMQAKALEKARKKQRAWEDERARNAGKVAAQQRLDYLGGLRQDPNFREFIVNAPTREVIANSGPQGSYGQAGGEHMFFDPAYLSNVTTTPKEYAGGGLVEALKRVMQGTGATQEFASGGLNRVVGGLGGLGGLGGGQDDAVDAKLSAGEYVLDADVVSALGDGSTSAGAAKLDRMREKVRAHKRKAPKHKIPPKAKNPEEYL